MCIRDRSWTAWVVTSVDCGANFRYDISLVIPVRSNPCDDWYSISSLFFHRFKVWAPLWKFSSLVRNLMKENLIKAAIFNSRESRLSVCSTLSEGKFCLHLFDLVPRREERPWERGWHWSWMVFLNSPTVHRELHEQWPSMAFYSCPLQNESVFHNTSPILTVIYQYLFPFHRLSSSVNYLQQFRSCLLYTSPSPRDA